MPDGKTSLLDPKQLVKEADKRLDPIGVCILVVIYFIDKWSHLNISLTFEEAILINIGAGAARSIWEGYKRRTNFNVEETK